MCKKKINQPSKTPQEAMKKYMAKIKLDIKKEKKQMSLWNNAVNKECLQDLAKLVVEFENKEMGDSEFRMRIIDRIYELDEPKDII